jgi:hypothetical protein
MKTFTLSKKDLAYLVPLDATMNGLNVAIQVYVINTVFKRLAIEPIAKARYDLDRGELYILEEKDMEPPKTAKQEKEEAAIPKREPEAKPEVKN